MGYEKVSVEASLGENPTTLGGVADCRPQSMGNTGCFHVDILLVARPTANM